MTWCTLLIQMIFPAEQETSGIDPLAFEFADGFTGTEKLTGQVCADDPVPLVERHFVESCVFLNACVVHKDIHNAIFGAGRFEHRDHFSLIGNIRLVDKSLAAFCFDFIDHCLGGVITGVVIDANIGTRST